MTATSSIAALLKKNVKLKRRNCSSTCCELVLPILLVLLIVFGYSLSVEESFTKRNYAGELLNLNLIVGGVLSSLNLAAVGIENADTSSSTDFADLYDYHGPTPVMDFDQFVTASKFLSDQASSVGAGFDISALDSTFDGLLKLGRIALSPDTPAVTRYREWMNKTYSSFNEVYIDTFADEQSAVEFAQECDEGDRFWALLHFAELEPNKIDVTIRSNYTIVPSTKRVFEKYPRGLDTAYRKYVYSGFLTLQQTVEDFSTAAEDRFAQHEVLSVRAFANASGESEVSSTAYDDCVAGATCSGSANGVDGLSLCDSLCSGLKDGNQVGAMNVDEGFKISSSWFRTWVVPYATESYTTNQFYNYAGPLMGMIICMSALYPVSQLTKGIVEEKETRMRELLKMMALSDGALNSAWTITYMVMFAVVALFNAILLRLTVFQRTDFMLLLLWLLLFFGSLVTYSFFLATFFSRAKLSAIVSPIALFATILPRYIFFTAEDGEAVNAKVLAAFLSPTCFTFAADQMARFEGANLGVTWDTMFEDEGLNFGVCLVMLAVDMIFYWLLAWYLDKVLPSMYGTPRKWYFCFQPSFWSGKQGGSGKRTKLNEEDLGEDIVTVTEEVPPEWKPSVCIDQLRKEFEDGAKVAVHSLSLDMFEGQITALLGHNGAGKTTTISCISGLIPATSGDCTVYGNSIQNRMDTIRRNMGICPQHDVLYAQLTVLEHLELFGTIKGIPSDEVESEALSMIDRVGLTEKINVMSAALSGGQKRKLSLGISLIGKCQFILCDEPTSGMDPYSRRATWELLRTSKKGRTVVLTTHFMDEADLLGDRIAIMTQGKLACIGSPLFLKKRYGIGYQLVLTKANPSCDEGQVHWFVKRHIPDAERSKSSAGEMVWRLPFEAITQFAALFSELEQKKEAFVVGSYGVSMTTLEECFIKIAEASLVSDDSEDDGSDTDEEENPLPDGGRRSIRSSFGNTQDPPSYASEAPPGSPTAQMREAAMIAAPVPASPAGILSITKEDLGRGHVTCTVNPTTPRQSPRNMTEAAPSMLDVNTLCKIEDLPGSTDKTDNEPHFSVVDTTDEPCERSREVGGGGGDEERLVGSRPRRLAPQPASRRDDDHSTVVVSASVVQDESLSKYDVIVPALSVTALQIADSSSAPRQPSPAWNTPRTHANSAPQDNADSAALDVKPESISLALQFKVQYKKRFLVARRDLKAVFYEVILPVILVFFVLCILFVEFNPAGPSIRLLPDIFGDYADTDDFLLHSYQEPGTTQEMLQSTDTRFSSDSSSNSYFLGENKLIPEISKHANRRMGSLTFGDDFTNNISLVLPRELLELELLAETLGLGAFGIDLNGATLPTTNLTLIFTDTDLTFVDASTGNNVTANITAAQDLFDSLDINVNISAVTQSANATSTGQEVSLATDDASNTFNITGSDLNIGLTQAAANALFPSIYALFTENQTKLSYNVLANLSVMFNSTSAHSLPSFMAEAAQARLSTAQGSKVSFIVRSHPLPLSSYQSAVIGALLSLFASLFLLVPFCYLPASYSMYVVKERTTMVKHVMLVSGQNLRVYWAATFAWDLTQYCAIMFSCMLVFLMFGTTVFTKNMEYAGGMVILLALYGLAAIPLAYCYSFFFDSHSSAQIGIATINFCTGWVPVVAYYIMQSVEDVKDINEHLDKIYCMFPPYVLGQSLLSMSEQSFKSDLLNMEKSVFHWDVCGKYFFILCVHCCFYIPMVLIIERFLMTEMADKLANCVGSLRLKLNECCCGSDDAPDDDEDELPKRPEGENNDENDIEMSNMRGLDEDVLRESNHVISGEAQEDQSTVLLINQLCKQYPPRGNQPGKVAVDNLSVSIQKGICFGLLGINGAGKSTTMAMLTGNVNATSGDALVNGYSIRKDLDKVRSDMGFCPQFDALVESLTAIENLEMFAKIKGIPTDMTDSVAQSLVQLVGLSKFKNRNAGTYSGGNKRKLSLAIALIGNPSLVLLDEPSTGMDPVARRQMWHTIERTAKGRSVVLTTHSMEECEALCDKVVVMVKGQFRCLGSVQHLKSRFGQGYTVELKTADLSRVDELNEFATNELLGTVEESMDGWLKCCVPLHVIELARLFGIIEERKEALQINDYSVSQTTLEQIFVRFARG